MIHRIPRAARKDRVQQPEDAQVLPFPGPARRDTVESPEPGPAPAVARPGAELNLMLVRVVGRLTDLTRAQPPEQALAQLQGLALLIGA